MGQVVSSQVLERLGLQERFDCWNRDELDPMLDMYAEDAVMDVSAVFADVAPSQGHQEMRRYWMELRETWRGLRLDPLEVIALGAGRYAVDLRLWGKGRRSGAEIDQRFAFLYTLRQEDAKVIRAELFPNLETATSVAAAGGTD